MQARSKIERVAAALVPAVVHLAEQLRPRNLTQEDSKRGFLLPYSEAEYLNFAHTAEYFYAVIDAGRLVGFVLAHSSDRIGEFGGEVYLHMKEIQKRPFTVIRQIGVDPNARNKGYGRMLYDFVAERVHEEQSEAMMMAFIWKRPPNFASELFHAAAGWREMEVYKLRSGERVAGIWEYTIPISKGTRVPY